MDKITKAFLEWANASGYDVAHNYNDTVCRWVFLNPMTAELYATWQAAQSVPVDETARDADNTAAVMPCGASARNVYEAYEAGIKSAQSVPVVGVALYAREQDLLAVGDEGATIFVSRTKPFTDWVPLYRAPAADGLCKHCNRQTMHVGDVCYACANNQDAAIAEEKK